MAKNMLGTRSLRDRSSSRGPETTSQVQSGRSYTSGKTKDATTSLDRWVEPMLSEKPSYREHNGSPYGVLEHMQPLGEAPNARVRQRVKVDGPRKSGLNKGMATSMGGTAQETPEGTPVPQSFEQAEAGDTSHPRIMVDDEKDEDYAPAAGKKGKERVTRPRAAKRRSEATKDVLHSPRAAIPEPTSTDAAETPFIRRYDAKKLKEVVEAAKKRARETGNPDLADAVNEIYEQSLTDAHLTQLVESILAKTASKAQTLEFQHYVRIAKKKLRDAKETVRNLPERSSSRQPLPLRSPAKLTERERKPAAIPTIERSELHKPKLSLKIRPSSAKDSSRRHNKPKNMSASPTRKRADSAGSDSSLTSLTSNGGEDDDLDMDGADDIAGLRATRSKRSNGISSKDHAAERGSLAAPSRGTKRSSAEAELQRDEDERVRELTAKKQRLSESAIRDVPCQESSIRELTEAASTPRTRLDRGRGSALVPPTLSLKSSGSRHVTTRSSFGASPEPDSPLSELSAASSRRSSPGNLGPPPKPFGKRAKTKQSPEKKPLAGYRGMPGANGAARESPIGDDDNNDELSENNDFCSACGGSGFLLCCDGCDRSFHFSCLDPPLNEDASELNEPWFCYVCIAKRPFSTAQPEKPTRGLFAPLLSSLRKRNPSNFALPQHIRDYFEGVAADKSGAFVEAISAKTRNRPGYDELPDYTKQRDGKGNVVLCYSCCKSSQGTRPLIQCDFCGENWHLDCVDPPLANPPARTLEGKKAHDWLCPLHVDHELRKVDTSLLNPQALRRRVHIRKPRTAKIIEPALRRGFQNNGVIDVLDDSSDDSDSEFFDEEHGHTESVVYKLPASGIKLDFIDKVKTTRVYHSPNVYNYADPKFATKVPKQLQQANFARRSIREQQIALNLAQFASANEDLGLGSDQVDNLVGILIAEAPSEVVDEIMAAEDAEKARSASSAIPPSPPSSEQTESLTAAQRKELHLLQELIRRKLETGKI